MLATQVDRAAEYEKEYAWRIDSGRHDAEMQEHSYKQGMLAAAVAQAAALETIAGALERIADRLDALTSAAGNLKVETP